MPSSLLTMTPVGLVALDRIRTDRPEVLLGFSEWLADVLDDLAVSSRGLLVSEAEVDDLLVRLQGELVRRVVSDGDQWQEDEAFRRPVVELIIGHLLAVARGPFVRRMLAGVRN